MTTSELTERFICPVPWCEGLTWTHGDDGSMPDEWLHESASVRLHAGLTVRRLAMSCEPERWVLSSPEIAELAEGATLDELATLLTATVDQLRQLAADANS